MIARPIGKLLLIVALFVTTASLAFAQLVDHVRMITPFDSDWRFLKSDAPGAQEPSFNDAVWRTLDVPHDWSIEGPFDQANRTGGAGAFLPAGVGWYRKHFSLSPTDSGRRIFIEFDGVMANSDVWINGFNLGHRPFGYITFRYELTGHLNFAADKPNVLAVRADDSAQPASRWYAGAGIYRHVRLIVTDAVHLDQWGTFVTTPRLENGSATVHVRSTVVNQSDAPREVNVRTTLLSPAGQEVASENSRPQTIAPGKTGDFEQDFVIKAQLWDLDHPVLYQAVVGVRAGNVALDDERTSFGIRSCEFKPDTGFWLNGKNLKIMGVCLHHEAGGLGAAVPVGAWEHRLAVLKELGCNAIRCAHNPPAPEFLDLCDRMGFIVMDETFDCWTVAKNPYDYHLFFKEWSLIDTRDTVRRDRNHPSVVLYSAGNEIHDTPRPAIAIPILKSLVQVFHDNDPTRPVTQALFRPNVSHDYDNGLADLLDVIGTNYRYTEVIAAHVAKPSRKIIGTENTKDIKNWLAVRDNPAYSGYFLWSGVDYLGESRQWPAVGAGAGLVDITDAIKPIGYQHQSWWSDRPMVRIFRSTGAAGRAANPDGSIADGPGRSSDWTPNNAASHTENVEVYCNCDQVELLLNDKSLGTKPRPVNDSARGWRVEYQPGSLKAVGRDKSGNVIATHELRTAGVAARLVLTASRAKLSPQWDDVCFITAQVVDANSVHEPTASDLIDFTIHGPAKLVALESADLSSHESFQAMNRHAFHGQCVAILRATAGSGTIEVKATAPGLAAGAITLEAAALPTEK